MVTHPGRGRCLFKLQDAAQLATARQRLTKARGCLARSHGPNGERLRVLHGNFRPELATCASVLRDCSSPITAQSGLWTSIERFAMACCPVARQRQYRRAPHSGSACNYTRSLYRAAQPITVWGTFQYCRLAAVLRGGHGCPLCFKPHARVASVQSLSLCAHQASHP